jgi:hypothetical protein
MAIVSVKSISPLKSEGPQDNSEEMGALTSRLPKNDENTTTKNKPEIKIRINLIAILFSI